MQLNKYVKRGIILGVVVEAIAVYLVYSCGQKYEGFGAIGCAFYMLPGPLVFRIFFGLNNPPTPVWFNFVVAILVNIALITLPFYLYSRFVKK